MATKLKIYVKDGNTRINLPGINLNFISFLVGIGFNISKFVINSKANQVYEQRPSRSDAKDSDQLSKSKEEFFDEVEKEESTSADYNYDMKQAATIMEKLSTKEIKLIIRVLKEHEPFTLVHVQDGDTEVIIKTK